ncbi:MAG TPA: TonB family protein [Candidatus Udaeobacter sp.]|nr:TonB family protein [Candidatus Udaeobacter sp.]
MADVWKQLEGQIVDNKFPLQQYLAGTEHSVVFLTECSAPKPQKAAIKFIASDPATADRQLSAWARAAHLSHPNLLRVLHSGRCRLSRMDLLYVVLECAEEDLSQVLPDRALTPSETRDLLGPLLDALTYLHGKNFVHSHISPANIHAIGDQLKLATDSILPSGDTRLSSRTTDVYAAPETTGSPLSSSADIWSLGATLVEVLTQRAPELRLDNQSNPTFPESLPQPFLDIVRHALRCDSHSRWTLAEIKARLSPVAAAAAVGKVASPSAASPSAASPAAGTSVPAAPASISTAPIAAAPVAAASVSPLAVPVSTVPAIPAAKLPTPRYDTPPPKPQALRQRPAAIEAPKQGLVLPNYVVPVLAVAFIVVVVIALPKILGRRPESSTSSSATSSQPASQSKPTESAARRETAPSSAKSAAPSPVKTTADKKSSGGKTPDQKSSDPSLAANAATPAPSPASLRTDTPAPAKSSNSSSSSLSRAEVLDQVLPEVPEKARATIRGRVRVSVRAHVDAAGNVSEAELDSPGPSKYFAALAVKAARRWLFTSPEVDGRSVPSEWIIRFVFTQSDTKAFPTQSAP